MTIKSQKGILGMIFILTVAWKEKLKCMKWLLITFVLLLLSGITDDDLRETAYEILLAGAGAMGYASIILFGLQIILCLLDE